MAETEKLLGCGELLSSEGEQFLFHEVCDSELTVTDENS
jgi:hypothetical protein